MAKGKYCPSHLKVTSKDPVRRLSDGLKEVLDENERILREMNRRGQTDDRAFGSFRQVDMTSDWALIAFSPYSEDSGITDTAYKTRQGAIDAAVRFFDARGFNAKPFNFYGMIDAI